MKKLCFSELWVKIPPESYSLDLDGNPYQPAIFSDSLFGAQWCQIECGKPNAINAQVITKL